MWFRCLRVLVRCIFIYIYFVTTKNYRVMRIFTERPRRLCAKIVETSAVLDEVFEASCGSVGRFCRVRISSLLMSPQKTVAASASVFRAFFLCCLVVFLSFIVFFVVCCVSFGSFYAHVFAAPGFFFFFSCFAGPGR